MKTYVQFLFLASFLALFAAPLFADDETPAEESVCDVLADGAAGLFGLCNAYCEAQDCDSYAEGEEPPSCRRLLANYERQAGADDPPMPCLEDPNACPCWTMDHLVAADTLLDAGQLTSVQCFVDEDPPDSFSVVTYVDPEGDLLLFNASAFGGTTFSCLYGAEGVQGMPAPLPNPGSITEAQNGTCRAEILALTLNPNFNPPFGCIPQ